MKVTVSPSAGFCFGVNRAIHLVYELIEQGKKVCTLGPIIHNNHMVEEFSQKGVRILEDVFQAKEGEWVVLRSHGVTRQEMQYLNDNHIPYTDAACPYVTRIQQIVWKESGATDTVVIVTGDEQHPEVQSVLSYCRCPHYVVDTADSMLSLLRNNGNFVENKVILVSQTTFNIQIYEECVRIAKKVCTNHVFFDTICNATAVRQQEAIQLAQKCDIMVVVGGRHSSNTAKLRDVCQQFCPTVLVESAVDLNETDFIDRNKVGLTAGASTPARIIKEVQTTMSEFVSNVNGDDISFEEGLEQTLKSVRTGDRVTGVVTAIAPTEVQVEIGTKHAGYIPVNELTDDPNKTPEDIVKVGDELELVVTRVNDVEGTVSLSKRRLDAIAGYEKVCEAAESGEVLDGVVVDVVRGGVIAVTNGTKVFIPASQATASRNDSLEALLKQPVSFKIIEVNRGRRRAVGSIRSVLKEQRKMLQDKFWEDVEVGKVYQGTVKSFTNYGAFIGLGGVDGMIHISELSWQRIKHPSEVLKEGDIVEVYIKDLDNEARKISLGYKKVEDNPWEVLKRTYAIDDVVKAKVVSMTSFGVFANIIPGIDGLIHISQISKQHVEKPQDVLAIGQEVDVKITDIDFDKKRVSLSIRALLEEPAQNEAGDSAPDAKSPIEEAEEKTVVYEVGPDGAVGDAPAGNDEAAE